MIGIVGHMSGGKTYTAVKFLLEKLAEGHQICTNIKLNCQGVTKYLGIPCCIWKQNYFYLSEDSADWSKYHTLSLFDYQNYPMGAPRGDADYDKSMVYIFLDEVSSVFDSITHSSNDKVQAVATWARHTLKRGQQIICIMQFSSELHKRIRNHITEYWSCVNTSTLRIPLVHWRLPRFLRGYIITTKFLGDEETAISPAQWSPLDSRVYSCYYTSQIVYGGEIGTRYNVATLDFSQQITNHNKALIWLLSLTLLALNLLSFFILSFISR